MILDIDWFKYLVVSNIDYSLGGGLGPALWGKGCKDAIRAVSIVPILPELAPLTFLRGFLIRLEYRRLHQRQ